MLQSHTIFLRALNDKIFTLSVSNQQPDSVHMSTCCVEMFNLINTQEQALLVRPCIGAVIVKAFERDQYYLVTPEKK